MEVDLFGSVMNDRWNEVVLAYTDISGQEKKITASEETALHMAVQFGKTSIVKQLVEKINASRVLELVNKNGDTALHLAAALGDVAMCHCMAQKDHSRTIIRKRNCKGETPLFLAALYGQQQAFFRLRYLYHGRLDFSLCMRTNGDTILHSAIFREHFGLALQIIDVYPDLVNRVDNNGFSPLHILASKPNAFATSCPLGPGECLMYICIKVYRLVKDHLLQAVVVKSCKRAENRQNSYNRRDEENPQPAEGTHRTSSAEIESLRDGENSQPAKECGTRLKNLVAAMVSLVYTAIASILFLALVLVRVATFGLLDIKLLISRGIWKINRVNETEKRHKLAANLLDKLVLKYSSAYKYENARNLQNANRENAGNSQNGNGGNAENLTKDDDKKSKKETPILIAARMGVTEVVKQMLDKFPVASFDLDSDHKNVVLLAAENKRTEVYKLLMKKKQLKERMFAQLDCQGNSALHLAATFKENLLGNFPEAATQMRWELEWYQFVKRSMPPYFFTLHNKEGKTAEEIFTNEHKELLKRGSEWLMKTSEACSVVAALIATVAFATIATVPGGNYQNSGLPIFEGSTLFGVFAISSLLALCLSVTALVYFLAIRTSGFKEKDFVGDLPKKLFVGLGSLSASLASILVSFCSRHLLMLDDSLKAISKPIYVFTGSTVIILFAFHLPFYYRLLIFNF